MLCSVDEAVGTLPPAGHWVYWRPRHFFQFLLSIENVHKLTLFSPNIEQA